MFKPLRWIISSHVLLEDRAKCCPIRLASLIPLRLGWSSVKIQIGQRRSISAKALVVDCLWADHSSKIK
jgi:hypothetical protein